MRRRDVRAIAGLPLACLSFAFFCATRAVLVRLVDWHFRGRPAEARRWRILSAESLQRPLALPIVMTTAPRWNTHAIVATVGPLQVRDAIEIQVTPARRSAASWSIVVYTFPGHATVCSVGSTDDHAQGRVRLPLPPGRYLLGVRYYRWRDDVELPAVFVDGDATVEPAKVPADVNTFLHQLRARRSLLHRWLHYHVRTLLRLRDWVPEPFLQRRFLPVGNPDTRFVYDAVERGAPLRVRIDPVILQHHDVYFTLYDRWSLPVMWCELDAPERTLPPAEEDGFYVLRVHQRVGGAAPYTAPQVEVVSQSRAAPA
jgi:hypothetical protein